MATRVYLIRHGQYENPSQIAPYRLPGFHLSEKGKRDVTALSETLSDESISAVFTSPLERTRETAEVIAKSHGLNPIVDERLMEMRSPLQGKTVEQIDALGGWNWSVYDAPWYALEHGETLDQVYKRFFDIVEEKRKEYPNTAVVLVSHGDPIMVYVAQYLGVPRVASELAKIHPYVPMAGGYKLVFEKDRVKITPIMPRA